MQGKFKDLAPHPHPPTPPQVKGKKLKSCKKRERNRKMKNQQIIPHPERLVLFKRSLVKCLNKKRSLCPISVYKCVTSFLLILLFLCFGSYRLHSSNELTIHILRKDWCLFEELIIGHFKTRGQFFSNRKIMIGDMIRHSEIILGDLNQWDLIWFDLSGFYMISLPYLMYLGVY